MYESHIKSKVFGISGFIITLSAASLDKHHNLNYKGCAQQYTYSFIPTFECLVREFTTCKAQISTSAQGSLAWGQWDQHKDFAAETAMGKQD